MLSFGVAYLNRTYVAISTLIAHTGISHWILLHNTWWIYEHKRISEAVIQPASSLHLLTLSSYFQVQP
jgi:hypothetical protein